MTNTQTDNFNSAHLQREYENVRRYFDITMRTTSTPYFPSAPYLLSEADLLKNIKGLENEGGLSLYFHIPFCEGKCAFCDLYCFNVPVTKRTLIDEYIDILEEEIEFWGRLFDWKHREGTTVHFGGGSPLIIGPTQIERLLKVLEKHFHISKESEIAVEITSSQMTPKNVDFFTSSEISRIHVGIQTLSDPIRKLLGRRESSRDVLKKLERIRQAGFITSVDILYGLPLQTMRSFEDDLLACIDLDVDGFALYELQISRVFNRIIEKNPSYHVDKLKSYQMLLMGKRLLNDSGYENVFYNHYGNHRDKNLYFTYPKRGEDCLAFGTITDARLGSVVFRHGKYKRYIGSVTKGGAGIDFGYLEDDRRGTVRQFETHLMSTHIPVEAVILMTDVFGNTFMGIFQLWRDASLLEWLDTEGEFRLTGSGCWLLSAMMDQIRRLNIQD